ncbi:MAG: DUF805 domain-containing protein [Betaproteobacteria bacterium]|nr:DUF805 domain-containing protein [Betaproteobacteria bacterium]
MSRKVRIVFRGEIIAGEVEAQVKQRAAQLFKVSPEQVEKLFSGKPIVLRKELPEEEGPRYRKRLEQAGMHVYIEEIEEASSSSSPSPIEAPRSDPLPDTPGHATPAPAPAGSSVYKAKSSLFFSASEPAATAAAPQGTPLALEQEAPAEEMECPKCGAKQPIRTLCWECGVDMQRILKEREAERGREKAEKGLLAEPGQALAALHGTAEHLERKDPRDTDNAAEKGADNLYRAPAARLETASLENDETAGLMDYLSFGPSGCMKRKTYLTANFFILSIYLFIYGNMMRQLAHLMSNDPSLERLESASGLGLLWIVIIPLSVYGIRIMIQRCRDIGWSPWLVLLMFAPLVNGIFGLCLVFWPSAGDDAPQGKTSVLLVSIGLCVLSGIWFSSGVYKMSREVAQQVQQQAKTQHSQNKKDDEEKDDEAQEQAPQNRR